uniref:No apical meristem-associated C-terminal domain-containing protein n=1 Tax=Leersia perrieri TaxID=77586 RepID=A0A0D9V3Z1_9ORYZ
MFNAPSWSVVLDFQLGRGSTWLSRVVVCQGERGSCRPWWFGRLWGLAPWVGESVASSPHGLDQLFHQLFPNTLLALLLDASAPFSLSSSIPAICAVFLMPVSSRLLSAAERRMDINSSGSFLNLQDPTVVANLSQSSTPPGFASFNSFPYAHVPFPLFSTQPPPSAAAEKAGPSSRRRKRVTAKAPATNVEAAPADQAAHEGDGPGRMYYRVEEDIRLNAPPPEPPRPVGIKKAKKGKEKVLSSEVVEMLETLTDAQVANKEEDEKMKEFQLQISEKKIEATNNILMAAEKKLEAKRLDHKKELLFKMTEMLKEDT